MVPVLEWIRRRHTHALRHRNTLLPTQLPHPPMLANRTPPRRTNHHLPQAQGQPVNPDTYTSHCTAPNCNNNPDNQYRKAGPDGSTTAYFACTTHAYTDITDPTGNQRTGLHTTTCGMFPCTCTPTPPVSAPSAPMQQGTGQPAVS